MYCPPSAPNRYARDKVCIIFPRHRIFASFKVTSSERRTSLMDVYQIASPPNTRHPSPEGRTTRSPNDQEGTYLTEGPTDTSGTISSSRTPAGGSSLSSPLLLTSTSEARWDDGSSSYESLPDAVKELQGMFGDTYESYPPDFPMSLR